MDQRINALLSLKDAFQKNETALAEAISLEMGKVKAEALTEAKSLSARIDLIINHGLTRVRTESHYDLRAMTTYHNQGVLVVLGPYNFPAHLVNSHVIPSILLGNTVVIKPSEVCPLVAQIYAQCVEQSALPKGVINVVHGDGAIGKMLSQHRDVDGVLFTGSYRTGRMLTEALLDQPHKILALEMGGKNFSLVMDDADLNQALLEIIQAAFLTTGQRCTATSRVLVHEHVYDRFREMLVKAVRRLKPCLSTEDGMFGPLATQSALDNFLFGLAKAKEEGAEVLVESEVMGKGAFVTPSLYQLRGDHPLQHYLMHELFGPNIALEPFTNLDHAIARINQSPYGLSSSIFTFRESHVERMMHETKSGVLNINRSTNNAFGQMPFGGVNRSGNQRPAGIDAVKNAVFPMAITRLAYGVSSAPKSLEAQMRDITDDKTPLAIVALRHRIEAIFELYGMYSDMAANDYLSFSRASFAGLGHEHEIFFSELATVFNDSLFVDERTFTITLSRISDHDATCAALESLLQRFVNSLGKTESLTINVPHGLEIPRSRAMLDRLYRGKFFPEEKKTLVADLKRSKGAFLASVDDNPLVLFDAASQIATLGAGFAADTFQNAYDNHDFDRALMRNADLSLAYQNDACPTYQGAVAAKNNFEAFIHRKTNNRFDFIAYGAGGAEANEIAFDLARMNGPGGTRILAFEGSFHGRTIMALQATYNKEKRGPFAFDGYEASFLPFPEHKNPDVQPAVDKTILAALAQGQIPEGGDDVLLTQELASLAAVKKEIESGNICAVIVEPMQCEGGDKYASDRFFSGLRALTRGLRVPLIFDEVQTGFHLGRAFFWYQQMNLIDQHGNPEIPDCMTLAKKAQLGVCVSVWRNQRVYTPHVIQLQRGLLHAHALENTDASRYEAKAKKELARLKEYFPELILHPRACGFAFAFDMPSKALATELVDQRFQRGFMAYIAGESTLRFRLNTACSDELINRLFENIFLALVDIRDGAKITRTVKAAVAKPALGETRLLALSLEHFDHYRPAIEAIENATYEEGRRDSMDGLRRWLTHQDSLALLMTAIVDDKETVLGYAFGGPLEQTQIEGAKDDPHHGQHDTFYSANITVSENLRGSGIGRALKNEQLKRVAAMLTSTNEPRYHFMSGRNRVGLTQAMNQINDNLGAYLVSTHDNQYGEPGAKAIYYRLPVTLNRHPVALPSPSSLDCQNSMQRVFKLPPPSFMHAIQHNHLRAITSTKLTLSNWATPHVVRYSELLRALMPKHLHHTYFTSGRDEVLDKGLRCLRYHRQSADVVVGFSHQWFGHNSAAARSLSHDDNQAQPYEFFSWPKISHPALVGHQASVQQLHAAINKQAPDKVLGIVVELMGERSGLVFSKEFLNELDAIRAATGIPLVFVENASSFYRSGQSLFLSDSLDVKANMVLWYTGGQLGHVMVDDRYYTDKPLTLISTWDGDEISIVRAYHHLLEAQSCSSSSIQMFAQSMMDLASRAEVHGQGYWHGVRFKSDDARDAVRTLARGQKIYFGEGYDSTLMVCPKLDFSADEIQRIVDILNQAVAQDLR